MIDHTGFKIFIGFLGVVNTYFAGVYLKQRNIKLEYMNETYKYQKQKLEWLKQNNKQLN